MMNEIIHVALPTPLDHSFSYKAKQQIPEGCRVLVPFGRRTLVGFAVAQEYSSPNQLIQKAGQNHQEPFELKGILEVLDDKPILSPSQLALARWISQYYMHPYGEVLAAMLPAGVRKTQQVQVQLEASGLELLGRQDSLLAALLSYVFANRQQLSLATFEKRWEQFFQINSHESAKGLELKKLEREQFVSRKKTVTYVSRERYPEESASKSELRIEGEPPLKEAQQLVFDQLWAAMQMENSRPQLLHGITGSGKTEIYLHLIAALFRQEETNSLRQVLVLVPEISLTPQMTAVFLNRFPEQVAVVHSAMSDEKRWQELNRIRVGKARVLIGARSAVFAGFKNLAAIIVDEEHDQSYKQSSSPTYHARDLAVVRAGLEKLPVILGSATPSLESYHNAKSGRYDLRELFVRANAQALPSVRLLPSGAVKNKEKEYLTPEIVDALQEVLSEGKQAMVVANRRGYAAYLLDRHAGEAVRCPQCSISLTLHAFNKLMLCHYCGFRLQVSDFLNHKNPEDYLALGYGSQKIEDLLSEALPQARIARLDSDLTAKPGAMAATLQDFRERKIDILVGTQMLAKGHDFASVALIVILDVDHQLRMPDFRAGEKTFQLLVQAAGRSGRAGISGSVILQSDQPEHPVIQAALEHDYHGFVNAELALRANMRFPPFVKIIAFEISSENQQKLQSVERQLNQWIEEMYALQKSLLTGVQILGPSRPAMERVARRHRRVLLFSAKDLGRLRRIATQFLYIFKQKDSQVRVKIDVDPQSLM